jgi:hypothetical protein
LVAAAAALPQLPGDLIGYTPDQFRALNDTDRPALDRARKALAQDTGVVLSLNRGWEDEHDENLKNFKHLIVAFGLDAKCLCLAGQTNQAARIYLDGFRLAQATRKGGLITDGINALALELISTGELNSALPNLDAATCRDLAHSLEDYSQHRELPETTIANEKAWMACRFGLINTIGSLIGSDADAKRFAKYIQRSHDTYNGTTRLMLRLAAHAYTLDHQQPPAKVADLVPAYLGAAPKDWETGQEFQDIPPAPSA